jgi:hypothetical protein
VVHDADMVDLEQTARGILAQLQDAFLGKEVAEVVALLDDEVVLFGSASQSIGARQARAYVERVLDQEGSIRWGWDQVVPLLDGPGVLVFAVVGTVGFEDAQGGPLGDRDPFRMTCIAVGGDSGWRLRHFHGSVPQQG